MTRRPVFPAIVATFVAASAVVSLAVNAPAITDLFPTTVAVTAPVTEDSPLWDCRTMGNRQCGEGTVGGPIWSADDETVACLDDRAAVVDSLTPVGVVCQYDTP